MTTHPPAPALGAYMAATAAPAENKASCAREKSKPAASITGTARPSNCTVLPLERSLASAKTSRTGNCRSSSTFSIISPTRPVAPSTATLHSLRAGSGIGCAPHNVRCARRDVRVLSAMAQVVIHKHDGQHGFGNRRRAQPHAGIVAAGGDNLDRLPIPIHRAARHLDAGGGLEGQVRHDRLAGGDPPQHAPG